MKKFRKRVTALMLGMLMVFSSIGAVGVLAERAYAAEFSILGQNVDLKNAAYSEFDTVFVPLEEVLGYINLSYTKENDNYTIKRMNTTAEMQAGNMVLYVNGERAVLSASPKVRDGVLYVPAEFFSVALDIPVSITPDKRSANISPNVYTVPISEDNAAAVSAVKPEEDVLSSSATGTDILRDQMDTYPTKSSFVYYKADLEFFKEMTVSSATLNITVTRNEVGPSITAIRTAPWEKGKITWNNQPALTGEKSGSFTTTQQGTINAALNIKTLVDAAMREDNTVYMQISGKHRAGDKNKLDKHPYTVKGVNTPQAPYLKITVDGNYNFPVKNAVNTTEADDENFYSDMGLLRSLGVFTQNDEFPLDMREGVLRQEFIRFALRLRRDVPAGKAEQLFSDVAPDSPYFNEIMSAYELGYISGGEGMAFRPYDRITIGEAVTILGRMLGYDIYAKERGGFTPGYFAAARLGNLYLGVANDKELLSFKKMVELLEDSLDASILEVVSYTSDGNAEYTFNENKNILTEFWNAKVLDNTTVTANEYSTLIPGESGSEGYVKLGTKKLKLNYEPYNNLLGYSVKAWYNDEDELLYMGAKSKSVDNYDISSIESVTDSASYINFSYQKENGKISNESFPKTGTVIYNGKAVSASNVTPALLEGDGGNIKIVGDDLVIITAYETVIVTSVDIENEKVYDLYDPYAKTLGLKDCDFYSFTNEKGAEVPLSSIEIDDVLSVQKSLDKKLVRAIVAGDRINGRIDLIEDASSEDMVLTVGGAEYSIANHNPVWTSLIELGASGSFYVDLFGNIVGFECEKLTDISGYVVTVDEGGDSSLSKELQAAIMTKSSEDYIVYTFADKVEIDGKMKKTDSDIRDCFNDEITGEFKPQGIIFGLNKDGEINKVDTYYKESQKNDPDDKENPETTLNKRTVSTTGRYEDGTFYNYYFLKKATTLSVLNTGSDEPTIDDYQTLEEILPETHVRNTTELYTLGYITPNVTIAYAQGTTSTSVSKDDRLMLFDRAVVAYDEDGYEATKIHYYDGANKGSVILRDDLTAEKLALISTIKRGDIFRFATDSSGKLTAVERVYDHENKAFATYIRGGAEKKATNYLGAGQYKGDNRVYGGYTTHLEDGYIRISEKPDATQEDMADTSTLYLWNSMSRITKAGFYKFTADSAGVEVMTATEKDIRLSSHAPLTATGIILLDNDDVLRSNVWLLDLSEMYMYSYSAGDGVDDATGVNTSTRRGANGMDITLADAPSRPNYDFMGWDVGGTIYQPGEAYTISGNVTIKATWVYNPTINFFFKDPTNANALMHTEPWSINRSDGSGYSEHTLPTQQTLETSGYIKEGYKLVAWTKGSDEYAPGETYIPGNDGYTPESSEGGTFEAVWVECWSGLEAAQAPDIANDGYYEIDTAEDLAWFANAVKTNPGLNARLVSDIYMNYFEDASGNMDSSWYTTNAGNAKNWQSFMIGTSSAPYTGTFDGNGKTVYNPYLRGLDIGIFGVVSGATIKNVIVANGYVESTQASVGKFVSLLCFSAKDGAVIQGCTVSGKIVPASSSHRLHAVGSIVGVTVNSTVKNCTSSAVIDSTGGDTGSPSNSNNGFGGIVGKGDNGTNIENCTFTGTLNSATASYPAGILGRVVKNASVRVAGCSCGTYTTVGVKGSGSSVATS